MNPHPLPSFRESWGFRTFPKLSHSFHGMLGYGPKSGCAFLVLALSISSASAAPVQWKPADGGNGHYYDLIFGSASVSWTDARTLAAGSTYSGLPGHLTTINSAGEDDFLKTHFESEILLDVSSDSSPSGPFGTYGWIGLSDLTGTGAFEWVTGEPLTYTNWAPGEPNSIGSERFGHIWRRNFGSPSAPLWSWNNYANTPSSRRLR